MADQKFIGRSGKARLAFRAIRACALSALLFGSFTGALYFPHKNIWWRISESVLAAMLLFATVKSYWRRKHRRAVNA